MTKQQKAALTKAKDKQDEIKKKIDEKREEQRLARVLEVNERVVVDLGEVLIKSFPNAKERCEIINEQLKTWYGEDSEQYKLYKQVEVDFTKERPRFSFGHLHYMKNPSKVMTMLSPATWAIIIGAKDSGKTGPVKDFEIAMMETFEMAGTLDFRKYKMNGMTTLANALVNASLRIQKQGFITEDYQKTKDGVKRMTDKRYKDNNAGSLMSSFDDQNGVAGIEGTAGGLINIAHIDEPVLKDDLNIPSEKQWNTDLMAIEDSAQRSRREYLYSDQYSWIPPYKLFETCNNWCGDHPSTIFANKVLPEKEFYKYVLGYYPEEILGNKTLIENNWLEIRRSILDNHTYLAHCDHVIENGEQIRVNKDIVRNTKFANDSWIQFDTEAVKREFQRIKTALINKDSFGLAISLGMEYEGSGSITKTYDLSMLEVDDTIKLLRSGEWNPTSASIGWDVDINSDLVCSTVVGVEKEVNGQMIERCLHLPQVNLPANGSGAYGEHNEVYAQMIVRVTEQMYRTVYNIPDHVVNAQEYTISQKPKRNIFRDKRLKKGFYFFIDDDRKQLLLLLKGNTAFNNLKMQVGIAKKHADYKIIGRQNYTQDAITENYLIDDLKNTSFRNCLKASDKKEGKDQRDESGKKRELYHTINAFEYAFYPLRARIRYAVLQ